MNNQQKILQFPSYSTGVGCSVLFGVEIFDGATLIYTQEAVLNGAINSQGASLGITGNINNLDVTGLSSNKLYTYNFYVKDTCVSAGARQDLQSGFTFKNVVCCEIETQSPPICKYVSECLAQVAEDAGSVGGIVYFNALTNQISFTTASLDTDVRLSNPHFIAVAPVGFNRLAWDLYDHKNSVVLTPDFTFVDIPVSAILTACEIEGDGLLGSEIKIKDSFYDSIDITDVTGDITVTDPATPVKEAFVVKDGCSIKVFVGQDTGLLEFTGGDITTLTDLQNAKFVEISIDNTLPADVDVNAWYLTVTNSFEGQEIVIFCNEDLHSINPFGIFYTRETLAHIAPYEIYQEGQFFSFTVVNKAGVLQLKLN